MNKDFIRGTQRMCATSHKQRTLRRHLDKPGLGPSTSDFNRSIPQARYHRADAVQSAIAQAAPQSRERHCPRWLLR